MTGVRVSVAGRQVIKCSVERIGGTGHDHFLSANFTGDGYHIGFLSRRIPDHVEADLLIQLGQHDAGSQKVKLIGQIPSNADLSDVFVGSIDLDVINSEDLPTRHDFKIA